MFGAWVDSVLRWRANIDIVGRRYNVILCTMVLFSIERSCHKNARSWELSTCKWFWMHIHIFNASSSILGQSDERAPQYVGKMVGNFDFKIQINRSCKCCKHGIITSSLWKFRNMNVKTNCWLKQVDYM
jgi:hypothetical protein